MILVIGSVTLLSIFGLITYLTRRKSNDGWVIATVIIALLTFAILISFIVLSINTPNETVALREKYIQLQNEIEHVDVLHYLTLQDDVDSYNRSLSFKIEAKKSPWLNWFYREDISGVDFLEMPPLDIVKEVFSN